MKIIQINSGNVGSTGNIMLNLAKVARDEGHIVYTACPDSRTARLKQLQDHLYIGNRLERNIHIQLGKLTGLAGCYSKHGTKVFLAKVDRLRPDIIHLHNLHNSYINLDMLFGNIKKNKIKVVWTLHDCWAFTGKCPHFTAINCNKWKTGCSACPQYRHYPESWIDRTEVMYRLKKTWFTGVNDLMIVTPSQWLADTVRESFLGCYPVRVINNGIDLNIFKPTPSDFRERHQLDNKIVILGVASGWGFRKGLDIFIELAKILEEKYQIVLVGLSTKQICNLPGGILGLPRMKNPKELAEIYSAADWFINPSVEETMGLVTAEALACGTPAVVSNSTAVPEVIDNHSGIVVNQYSANAFAACIENSIEFTVHDCIKRAREFDMRDRFNDYVSLYDSLI